MKARILGVAALAVAVAVAWFVLGDDDAARGDADVLAPPTSAEAPDDEPLVPDVAPVESGAPAEPSESAETDAATGRVTLYRRAERRAETDGAWRFTSGDTQRVVDVASDGATVELPAGVWMLAAPDGLVAAPSTVELAPGAHVLVDVVAIAPLRVRVVDPAGAPVRGAAVAWHGRGTVWTTATDREHVVPDGEVAVRTTDVDGRAAWPASARGEGYQPVAKVIPRGTAPLTPGASFPDLDESTDSPAIRRLARDAIDTVPHESTSTTGCYVSASREGVGFASQRIWPGATDDEVVLTLDRPDAARPLRVADALDGAPVAGALLLRDGRPVSSISGEDGRLRAWLPSDPGPEFVLAAPGCAPRTINWIDPDVETLTLAPLARLRWTVATDAAPSVAIRTLRDDGEPDTAALLPRWTEGGATRGAFVVPRGADVEIEAVAARRVARRVPIDAPEVSVDLGQLTAAPFLEVVAPGAHAVRVLAPSAFRTRPVRDGRARVFAADAYQLRVRYDGHEIHVTDDDGATERGGVLTLDSPSATRQSIRVVDETDRPVAGVFLRLQAPAAGTVTDDHRAWTPRWLSASLPPTDGDGRTSAALPPGRYDVKAWFSRSERIFADTWAWPIDRAITVTPAPGEHELRVGRSRRVTLDVRWSDGAPVARFDVVDHGEGCCGVWTRWLSASLTELSVFVDGAIGTTVAVPPGDGPITVDVVLERGDLRPTFTTRGLPDDVERLRASFFHRETGTNTFQRAFVERESPGRFFAPDAVLLDGRRVTFSSESPDGSSYWESDLIDGDALAGALVEFEREDF